MFQLMRKGILTYGNRDNVLIITMQIKLVKLRVSDNDYIA